jgi:hypothetical protein
MKDNHQYIYVGNGRYYRVKNVIKQLKKWHKIKDLQLRIIALERVVNSLYESRNKSEKKECRKKTGKN